MPKKPTHQDIQEIKTQAKLESTKKPKQEELTPKRRPSLHAEPSVIVESPNRQRPKLLQRSYQSIDEFMRDIDATPTKLDMTSTKVTSTPSRNVRNILQDSYTFGNESDGQSAKQDALWALASPKNSKSLLKSTSGNMGSTVKKKVIFDLEKEDSPDKESKSMSAFIVGERTEEKELHEHGWNATRYVNHVISSCVSFPVSNLRHLLLQLTKREDNSEREKREQRERAVENFSKRENRGDLPKNPRKGRPIICPR